MNCGLISTIATCLALVWLPSAGAIEEGVFYDPITGNYTVRYIIPADDEGPETVEEGTFYPSTKIVPVLTSSLQTSESGRTAYNYSVLNSLTGQQPLIIFGLPCDGYTVLEGPSSAPGWQTTINSSNRIPQTHNVRWGYRDLSESPAVATKGLGLGKKQAGFGLVSAQLPGVGMACFVGNAPMHTFSDEWLDADSPVWAQIVQLKKNDRVLRFAAIPTFDVPNPFDGATLLERIRDHVKNWPQQQLMDQAFWQQIDGLLNAAIVALKSGDSAGASVNLLQIRAELRKQYPDLDATTALDDPNAESVPSAPDALTAFLSAHDQRLAAKVLDFDVDFVQRKLVSLS